MILAIDFAHDIAAIATLVTAIGGFVAVILRQRSTDEKVTQTEVTVDKVYRHVNGVDEPARAGEPATLGQTVRQVADRLERIERELGIEE